MLQSATNIFLKNCFLLGDSKNLGQRAQVLKKETGLNLGPTVINYDSMTVKLLNPAISSTIKLVLIIPYTKLDCSENLK